MENEKKLKVGAIYVRVSTGRQDEHELSPDSQIKLALDYARKNSIVVPADYIFHEKGGVSGKRADRRPYFQQMIGLAKSQEHPIDVILVWKYSRFARNQEESIVYKTMLRKNCNVDVISISEPLVEGPFGSLIERIIEWMDEYYVIRLSGEVTRGMTENALRGNYQARPPLGYCIEHKGEPPAVVPEEAAIVRMIFQKYVHDRLSLLEICRQLNALGLKTSRSKEFEKRSLTYILQNVSYTGKVRWNRTENETNRVKPEEEWIIAQGKQPAIITEELFEAAQERMKREYAPKYRKPSAAVTHWLGGLLKCSACGRTLSTSRQVDKRYGRTYYHFQCYGYLKGKCSVSHGISEKKIVPDILDAIRRVLDTQEIEFEVKQTVAPDHQSEYDLLSHALGKISQKEERIRQAYRDGIDSLEEYKENKEILQREREELEQRLAEMSRQKTPETDYKKELLERVSSVYDILLDEQIPVIRKNEAIKGIIEKIIYYKSENRITIFFYYS
ncbi:MAG: recombinase family protein [Lachnospiraceae bacterium]|nr:recombinase family protein [Lachnospiraceae bacterium]